jgi:hypothetical protein
MNEKKITKTVNKKTNENITNKKPVGRPTKYLPIYAKQAKKLAEKGLIDKDIYDILGIAEKNGIIWKSKYPEFRKGIEEGKETDNRLVENSLTKKALGYEYEEITSEPIINLITGEKTIEITRIVKKHVPASDSSIQFYLTNKMKEKYSNNQNINMNANINDASEMSPEERHNWLIENGFIKK